MSGTGTTIVIRDEASPVLAAIQTEAQAGGIAAVMGRAVVTLTREHLFALNSQRHRQGGRNYYAQAARSTHAETSPTEIKLSITQTGFRQRRFGGGINPRKKYLTIPACPEACGKRAGEFNDLDFAIAKDPQSGALRPALVQRVSQRIRVARRRTKDGGLIHRVTPGEVLGGKVMFWLVRSVFQKPDPSVLPANAIIVQTALDAATRRFFRLGQRQSDSTSS
jgi:hypothetical protein